MGKKGSIYYQLTSNLKNQQAFGQSKHAVKHKAIETARAQGKIGTEVWDAMNKAVFESGIFSFETYKSYHKVVREFSDFCKSRNVTGDLEKAKSLVSEYLQKGIEEKSIWSVKLDRAALKKAFRDRELAKEVKIPDRRKENITRSRTPVKTPVVDEKSKRVIDFARATGLRRRELAAVRVRDVYARKDKVYVHVRHGKGGKEREVPVLARYQDRVLKMINEGNEGNEGDKIFRWLPSKGIHVYRREYAQERYQELEKELEREPEREKNREPEREREIILREVSHDLGHSRIDVVTTYYL